jgi:8-oxo-dGTP diphosphatase
MKRAPLPLRFAVVAVDVVVFTLIDDVLHVLLQPHNSEYYKGKLALVGGIIYESESTDEAAQRILAQKSHVSPDYIEQLQTFSAINRDKRNRVVSVAHLALLRNPLDIVVPAGTLFVPVTAVSSLAYDHTEMLQVAIGRLQAKLGYTTIAKYLLPAQFTLTQLQTLYESILATTIDKRNFRKKILALRLVEETGERQSGVQNRPASLYRFVHQQQNDFSLFV